MIKLFLLILLISYGQIFGQNQPLQPNTGPGGNTYYHSSVIKHDFSPSFTSDGYWMYEPASPKPDSANVVVFNHGYGVYNPGPYGAWIEHLVKKGNIVIFPRYQFNITVPLPSAFTNNAAKAIKDALIELKSNQNYAQPKSENLILIGHSYGGVISSNLAVEYINYGIPKPKALMLCMPGTSVYTLGRINSYSTMDSGIHVLSIIGEDDVIVGDTFGIEIYNTTTNIPTSHKNLVKLKSDNYGSPNINAWHNVSLASDRAYDGGTIGTVITGAYVEARTNAVDFYCFWKLADALIDCSVNRVNCNYAFGDTPNQRNMGNWSDNTPVTKLTILPQSTVSIEEQEQYGKISAYPNPTSKQINLVGVNFNNNTSYQLVNPSGNLIITNRENNKIVLPENIENGLYYLILAIDNSRKAIKIIVKN